MSPRPTVTPWAAMVRSRCSAVIAKPSGSSPAPSPVVGPRARPTSSSTPRPARRSAAVSMPVTRSPARVTTSAAARPFQAWPWSKMCPSPSHCVEHCSGMAMTSSAPPSPCGNSPSRASRPVSSIVCTGLVRRRHPRCGPVHVERLRQRERRSPPDEAGALDALGVVEEVQGAQDVVGTPAAPVRDAGDGGGDGVLGLRRVEARREDGAGVAAGRLSRHCWSLPRTRCVLPHRAAAEHYRGTRTWRCGVWGFPMGER